MDDGVSNLEALRERLVREGFDNESYRVGGGMPQDGFVIKRHGAGWLIEYCEKGGCSEVESFRSEAAACERMYALMVKTVRRPS